MLRRVVVVVVTVAGLAALAPAAGASELAFFEVSQPFFQPNGGLEVHRVTYAAWVGSLGPGREIRYLPLANCTVQPGRRPPMLDSASLDQNVASRLGVRVTVEDRSDGRTWTKVGTRPDPNHPSRRVPAIGVDTLAVDVDLSRAAEVLAAERGKTDLGSMVTVAKLAQVLVACIRENASRSKPPIGFVRIQFSGAPEARAQDGVHRVSSP